MPPSCEAGSWMSRVDVALVMYGNGNSNSNHNGTHLRTSFAAGRHNTVRLRSASLDHMLPIPVERPHPSLSSDSTTYALEVRGK